MLFSIVIPTRERADTLVSTLQTCLRQSSEDYEIIVCDNCSSPDTLRVVEEANSSKIKYVRSDKPLSMSDNWDLAVSHAVGDYITVLGDDDGLMPYALREIERCILSHSRPSAVHWRRGLYTWPNLPVESEADFMVIPLWRPIEHHIGRDQILRVMRYQIGADQLPMIYNSMIRRDLVERHRAKAGRIFLAMCPDVYSGIAFAYLGENYITLGAPMNIAGLSGKSNGVANQMLETPDEGAKEYYLLHQEAGAKPHPTTPAKFYGGAYIEDCFQHARDLLFPDDQELVVDRRQMVTRCLAAIPDRDPAIRAEIRQSIRDSLADRPDLIAWFDAKAPNPPPSERLRLKPARFGFDGHTLSLDTTLFGVRDIAGAVELATNILGCRSREILYDLPMPVAAAPPEPPASPPPEPVPEPPPAMVEQAPPATPAVQHKPARGLRRVVRAARVGLRAAVAQYRI